MACIVYIDCMAVRVCFQLSACRVRFVFGLLAGLEPAINECCGWATVARILQDQPVESFAERLIFFGLTGGSNRSYHRLVSIRDSYMAV